MRVAAADIAGAAKAVRRQRFRRCVSRRSGSRPITASSCRRISITPTRPASGGRALAADRVGRALRAGRDRVLSVFRADERHSRQGRGRSAHRHGGAGARRRAQPSAALAAAEIAGVGEIYRIGGAQVVPARSPMARRRSRRSTRSPVPATPMSLPPSGAFSGRSASI